MASCALRLPCSKPLSCDVKRLEICRPAASSFALLMRRPDANLLYELSKAVVELDNILCAFIELTLVFTYKAIIDLFSLSVIIMNFKFVITKEHSSVTMVTTKVLISLIFFLKFLIIFLTL